MLIAMEIRHSRRLVVTRYSIAALSLEKTLDIAIVSDLHGCAHEVLVKRLRKVSPDMILLVGDIMENNRLANESNSEYAFLRQCAVIAPTYYSFGNHEVVGAHKKGKLKITKEICKQIEATGVTVLHNSSVVVDGIRICGLTSGLTKTENRPNKLILGAFAKAPEYRILLCHHPEYYEPYIRSTNIDLTVSGHAHGGQWRFFGRGVYAHGQGFFPKYTSGVIDKRFVISRGVGGHTLIPRIANPRELVILHCVTRNTNKQN
jgi:predicted MPP superfamily phosphohydrolase